jgi:hypothetical protein
LPPPNRGKREWGAIARQSRSRDGHLNYLEDKVETNRFDQVPAVHAEAGVAAASSAPMREQRMRSLGRANEIRTARATLKKELASGRVQIEDVLAQPPASAATAKVSDLLLAVPGYGPVRATRSLARCQIPYGKTAASLSRRQRDTLIALLRTAKPGSLASAPLRAPAQGKSRGTSTREGA